MRFPRFLLVFATLGLFVAGCGEGGLSHDTPTALAESLFKTLQSNDVASTTAFLPTEGDLRETYDAALERHGEEKIGPYNKERSEAAVEEVKVKMHGLWAEVREAGEKEGIDWAAAKQTEIEERSNEYVDQANTRVAEVALTLASGEESYVLLVGAAEYKRGWLLARLSLGK